MLQSVWNIVRTKVKESIVYSNIRSCFVNYISQHQNGFIPKRSTSSNLMHFVFSLFKNIASGRQVDVISTDFNATFNTLPNGLLLAKLNLIGLSGLLLSRIASFLSSRTLNSENWSTFLKQFYEPFWGASR